MNWAGLIKCVAVIFIMLVAYLILMNTKLKNKFDDYPFLPLGIILIILVIIGIIARIALM